jgi:hypothetical protein
MMMNKFHIRHVEETKHQQAYWKVWVEFHEPMSMYDMTKRRSVNIGSYRTKRDAMEAINNYKGEEGIEENEVETKID